MMLQVVPQASRRLMHAVQDLVPPPQDGSLSDTGAASALPTDLEIAQADPSRRGTALGRWVGLGPYYAMFPSDFAFEVVRQYSGPGQALLDPFAGRGTAVYAATILGRTAVGIEINPLGWLYGKVKFGPAPLDAVLESLLKLGEASTDVEGSALEEMPEFFHACYTERVLRFLLAARAHLDWQNSKADASLMAILMVYVHGAVEKSLSNQMRQGKALSPAYAVKWWHENNSTSPDRDPVEFLETRLRWRYAKGIPSQAEGRMILGDSVRELETLQEQVENGEQSPFKLLFTSPPYAGITDYHYDQWLRLWLLGGPPGAVHYNTLYRDNFENKIAYSELLHNVFRGCSEVLTDDAVVYVRTDARQFTYDSTLLALSEAFPNKSVQSVARPFTKSTQTALFGDKTIKPGEMDIILCP